LEGIKWHGPQDITVKAAQVYTLPINLAVDPYDLKSPISTITFVIKQTSPVDDVVFEQDSRFFEKQ
jgi:hypothetical protein